MRKFLLALGFLGLSQTAALADRPFSWSGFYAGAHVGYGWGSVDVTDTNGGVPPGPFSYDPKGAFGGGTAGYNLHFQNILIGVEGDLGYMSLNGSGLIPSSNPAFHQDTTLDGGLYAVAAGRIGFTVGQTLIYGKGGFAFWDAKASQTTTKPGYATTGSGSFRGGVLGGGVEHFIARNVTLKVEYLRYNFGQQGALQTSITDPPIGFQYNNVNDVSVNTVKLGVNFHF